MKTKIALVVVTVLLTIAAVELFINSKSDWQLAQWQAEHIDRNYDDCIDGRSYSNLNQGREYRLPFCGNLRRNDIAATGNPKVSQLEAHVVHFN